MFSDQSRQECQSKFYKDWHPDYIGSYNSLKDKHLKHFFRHPARQLHLTKNHQVGQHFGECAISHFGNVFLGDKYGRDGQRAGVAQAES